MEIDEKKKEEKLAEGAEKFHKKYKSQVEALEKHSLLAKARTISPMDICALGEQLEAYDSYEKFAISEAGSLNALGKLPAVAHDVITVGYGSSVLPAMAAVQTIAEPHGYIYFKNTVANTTKGNITKEDILKSPLSGYKTQSGYSSSKISSEVIGTGDGTTTTFTGTLGVKPLLRESLKITVQDNTAVYAKDVGDVSNNVATLIGAGIVSGQVNLSTGVFSIEFASAITNAKEIYAEYNQDYEQANDLPQMKTFMDHKPVIAIPYALKGVVGLFQSYSMQKRWGKSLENDLAIDLVAEMNKEIGGDLIRKIKADAVGTTTFDRTVPNAVSKRDHYEGFSFTMNEAESEMLGSLGRGSIGTVVVGRDLASLIQGLSGFKTLSESTSIGPHVFGTYGNKVIVRVPEDALLGKDSGLALHKGKSSFDSACYYAPYMPIVSTALMPEGANPLRSQQAAACIAAVDVAVPALTTNISVITS